MDYEDDKGPEVEGSESDEKILKEARKLLRLCRDDEDSERVKMMDDLRFCTLDQWPADIRRERENDLENGPRPCLTIDKINQYIVQVVNDVRQGKPGINVRPQDDQADVKTAKVLKGLVRNIEDQSSADIAYATAVESAAKIGLGYFRIVTEYASEDSFDQEIFIKSIPNTFSVYLGPHVMPDGSDAKHGFIIEAVPVEKFKEDYPKAKYKSVDFEDLAEQFSYWHTGETVTVVEYFCIDRESEELVFLEDGNTLTRKDYNDIKGEKPAVKESRTRVSEKLKWAKMTGVEVLEKRDLPGKYIPIVEVIGRESHIEGKRVLWGLVRPAKDSLRMYNYFASTITEKMGLAPKAPFIGAVGQFATAGDRWRKANRVNYAVLEYDPIDINGNAIPAPQRQGATPMEVALLQQMQVIEHDVQTSLGMFKAATGESESQQSGRAILALQRESETGRGRKSVIRRVQSGLIDDPVEGRPGGRYERPRAYIRGRPRVLGHRSYNPDQSSGSVVGGHRQGKVRRRHRLSRESKHRDRVLVGKAVVVHPGAVNSRRHREGGPRDVGACRPVG